MKFPRFSPPKKYGFASEQLPFFLPGEKPRGRTEPPPNGSEPVMRGVPPEIVKRGHGCVELGGLQAMVNELLC